MEDFDYVTEWTLLQDTGYGKVSSIS